MAVIQGFFYNRISRMGNEQLAVIRNSEVAVLEGSITVKVYVSSIRCRAVYPR